jgi:hypothetical protein
VVKLQRGYRSATAKETLGGKMIQGLVKKIAEAVSADRLVPIDIVIFQSRKKGNSFGQFLNHPKKSRV